MVCFRNSNFYGNRQSQLVSKKQFSDHIQANLDNIVCCRLREGFIIEVFIYPTFSLIVYYCL